jgi:co-chaperonin GroES (HSP10)
MKVTKPYIFIRIDKKAQKEKRDRISALILGSPQYAFMTRNLQYGTVLQIGELAQKNYPEAQVGDTILFQHTIEGDMETGCDRLIDRETDGNEILYLDGSNKLDNYEIYGIVKPDGTLIPAQKYVFLKTVIREIKARPFSSLIFTDEEFELDDDRVRVKLEELTEECEKLKETLKSLGHPGDRASLIRDLDSKYAERDRMTKYLNDPRLAEATVFAINSRTSKECAVKETDTIVTFQSYLYPLEVMGSRFLLAEKEDVLAVVNSN